LIARWHRLRSIRFSGEWPTAGIAGPSRVSCPAASVMGRFADGPGRPRGTHRRPGTPAREQRGAVDLPPPQPPLANAAPETGSGGRKPGVGAWIVNVFAMSCVVFGLWAVFFLAGGLNYSLHYIGWLRPTTTATIDHCDPDTGGETCYGRWSVGGVSHTGRIHGLPTNGHHGVGSQVDIDLRHGNAHYGHPGPPSVLIMSGSLVAIATGVVLWWSFRRRYKIR
jgi:hypothetical protein